jgi:hypothetical protein
MNILVVAATFQKIEPFIKQLEMKQSNFIEPGK